MRKNKIWSYIIQLENEYIRMEFDEPVNEMDVLELQGTKGISKAFRIKNINEYNVYQTETGEFLCGYMLDVEKIDKSLN